MRDFAPTYPRTEEGWVKFPGDADVRRAYFPPDVLKHPAKANLFMIEEIVKAYTEPGDMVMDPMSGTGTIMIAAALGRRVVCLEIEEGYHKLQREALDIWRAGNPEAADKIVLVHGDCRKLLPLPCDHIIFSPPYAGILHHKKNQDEDREVKWKGEWLADGNIADYSASPGNVGRLNTFFYNQEMEKVYALCLQSIKPGGTMTVILQDFHGMKYGERQRIYLSDWLVRVCIRMGFEQVSWEKRLISGTPFKDMWASKGYEVVKDEDIVTFRRP